MRLIDADKLKYEAELCRETTDAFQELINEQPDYYKPVKCLKCNAQWISYDEFENAVANYCPVCGQAINNIDERKDCPMRHENGTLALISDLEYSLNKLRNDVENGVISFGTFWNEAQNIISNYNSQQK